MTQVSDDDRHNNLIAAGALWEMLNRPGLPLTSVEIVTDADGNPTNQIDICMSFLLSPYRITIGRVTDA